MGDKRVSKKGGWTMSSFRTVLAWILPSVGVAMTMAAGGADTPSTAPRATSATYSYATRGILQDVRGGSGSTWRLLLDESNLGGKELEAAELILPAGTTVRSHHHGSVEVIYVLSGTYGHEVNGKLYVLKPGMLGIVRPGDSVRHLVPKSADAKLLILWAPAGEMSRLFPHPSGVTPEPVSPSAALDP
jgi:quercetin dioxygenase-like cupin family protein